MVVYFHSQCKVEISKVMSLFIRGLSQSVCCSFTSVHAHVRTILSHGFIISFPGYFQVTMTYILLISFCSLCWFFYIILTYENSDDSTWEGRNTATPLGLPDGWGSQVVQNEFSCEGWQATVPGGGMPGGVSNTGGDAGALCALARPRHRGYLGGGQPPPTTMPPVRPSGIQEGA